jgi:hypothetical protein
MKEARLATILTLLVLAFGLGSGGALGNVPGGFDSTHSPATPPTVQPASPPAAAVSPNNQNTTSDTAIQGEVFSKLKPVKRDQPINFDEATALLNSKTLNEQIFNKGFENKMRDQYANKVAPFEKTATNPIWRPSSYEMQQYESGRHDLAAWTTHEAMDNELKDVLAHGDQDSAPMKAIAMSQNLGGGGGNKPADSSQSPDQKEARSHRTDLPVETPLANQDAPPPTTIKTNVNVLKQNGSVVFSNPVAITSVNGSRDDVNMKMTREFHMFDLKTNANFGIKDEALNLNLSKKVVEHVSLDLNHYNYTGAIRGPSGEKLREEAKVNYSLSF